MAMEFSIGQAAKAADCKVQTIRYYEQIGLIPSPPRTAGNQRVYDETVVQRLKFIRHARELGFPLQAIRDLTSLSDHPDQSCDAADAIAKEQLADVEQRLRRLQALRDELSRMVDQCRGGRIEDCRVIEVLGDHSHCKADDHGRPEEVL